MPISGEVRFTFSTFVLLNSETGLSIACIFYLFVFFVKYIFLFVLLSILCTLLSVYVCVSSALSNRKGREGPSIHLLS